MKKGRRTNPIPPREIRIAFDMFLDRESQKKISPTNWRKPHDYSPLVQKI
jgi:hypothetical protein